MFKIVGRIKEIEEELKENKYPGKIKLEVLGKKECIIADEDAEFKAGEVKAIKIKKIELLPYTISIISAYAKHSIGTTLSIGEETPMPYGSKRIGEYAIFAAVKDGIVKKGDVIGNLLLLHGKE
ncbi:DUF22 domain-containing protein [Methanothermococcus okinawensis]|uniref:DUF22 domain-containing protein n=1 Tax=Methanothermococcus okinawensis (strain DSM 14208 / JCM 11175 / IH1) TaxID=647113 RepID=F8AK38_METOI|nr:DUF22 domain-containing protein [Methanothermococcus okinawensis]AEH07405.1 protein of unknown function DUF22 [Methanothermococcus okinawensis IH1]